MAAVSEPLPIHLPKCQARGEGFALSARQRRDIIRILAKDGKKGLEAWLREEEKRDPHIRRRLEEERTRIEREARQREREVEERYGQERGAKESAWEARMRDYGMREAELRDKLEKTRKGPSIDLFELQRSSDLFRAATAEEEERTFWQRVKDFFVRLWLRIVMWWVRLVRVLRGAARKEPDRARVFTLPDGLQIDLGRHTSLNPRMVAQVRKRMREGKGFKERMKQMWDRLLGREDYAEVAARLMEEELTSRMQAKRLELEADANEMEARLKEIEKQERLERRRHEEDVGDLEEKRERDLAELSQHLRRGAYESMREEVLEELQEAGLVNEAGDPTEALLERFSVLLYDEARRTLPAGGESTPGTFAGGEGEYHKGPLQSLNERGAIELVDSVIRARLNHPRNRHLYDSDLMVHREVRTAMTHVVLIFDQSGSMEEKGRLEAAKTVCLTMYRAVKDVDPLNRVDILAMSTGVEHVDLAGLWNAEPKGFTNHGAALREARHLLEDEGADRRLVYLITDGLPEAMTVRGVDTADRPEVCLPYALEQAKQLGQVEGTRLFVIQLETEEALFIDAAKQIADAAGGEMEAVEPEALTGALLSDLESVKQRERELSAVR